MSDEKGLLGAIWEHPHEDTPRLAYADWLDERGATGDAARAEFIRVQCQLAQLDEWDPGYKKLAAREKKLLTAGREKWTVRRPHRHCTVEFSRGFPKFNLSALSFPELLKLTEQNLATAPISRYHYNFEGPWLDRCLAWPGMRFQELFSPRPPRLPRGWVARAAACENLRNVNELCAIDCRLKPDEVQLLLDAWADRHLPMLGFAGPIKNESMAVIANHPTAAKVRDLDFRGAGFTAEGMRLLANSPYLAGVKVLNLAYCRIGNRGVEELLKWPHLSSVRTLELPSTQIGTGAAEAIAACPALANLRDLGLSDNRIGEAGCRALARSPHLKNLTNIDLSNNPGAEPARKELRERFGDAVCF